MMRLSVRPWFVGWAVCLVAATFAGPGLADPVPETELTWHTDYNAAQAAAKEQGKMLLIVFQATGEDAARDAFESKTLADPQVRELLQKYERLKVPVDHAIRIDGREIKLLDHGAFAEMLHRQGIAIVDYAHYGAKYYGDVVSTFPFSPGLYYRSEPMLTMLDLPPGTLTQRTLIYAVRMHPEIPQSTSGEFNQVLAQEAQSHSEHQARIAVQGHHSWDSRFHRINSRLGYGAAAQEVVAESWPGENLVEAAEECVRSWRHSPGHWRAVRSRHSVFGYDIKRSNNGVWYATGIFANLRR